MDLHSLHRPSPPAAQTTQQNHVHATGHDLARDLEKARSLAEHWQRETEKMDRIARSALDKLEAKRQAKRAIKTEYTNARKEADSWRARYKELSDSRMHQSAVQHSPDRDLEERLSRANREILDLQERLAKAQTAEKRVAEKLALAEKAIRESEAEVPAVREKLRVGGMAFRRLQALEPKVKEMEAEISTLHASAAKSRQLELEIVALKAKASQAALDLPAAQDKLRAATQDASAKTSKLQACADMLARAEQVLKTCSQLHATSEDSHGLAEALADTTDHIGNFLAKLENDSASRNP
jgi:DNA repair exonuclease SbcCD ATPase subunit